jgi:hypothetical protein
MKKQLFESIVRWLDPVRATQIIMRVDDRFDWLDRLDWQIAYISHGVNNG